jgi:UDP-glucuronate 4-epimerase
MKILVTGAAGFIGSHLANKLCNCGNQVVGLDNFNDYYDPQIKYQNANRLKQHAHFTMIAADIRDRDYLFNLFQQEKFDAVAHLAAMAGVRNAVEQPDLYIAVDYNGTQNLMDAARDNGVGNFVFASTSSVYGNTEQIPFVETDPCDRPLQPYAAAKRAAEILGYTYHYLYGLNFTAIRFFTVYGPNGRPDMMAHLLADSIYKGKKVPLYNEGQMYRDWTYVDDIVNGVIAALERPFGYEIINLGRGEPVLLNDFVTLMERLAGRKANLVPQSKLAADVVRTYANISKARRLLDYNPQTSVPEGVAHFWRWYVDYHHFA